MPPADSAPLPSDPAAARIERGIASLRIARAEIERLLASEPAYGLVVGHWARSSPPAVARPALPGFHEHQTCHSGYHFNDRGDVALAHEYFRDQTAADRYNAEHQRRPEDVGIKDLLRAAALGRPEPMVESLGRLGGLYLAYGPDLRGEGLPRVDQANAWAEAVYERVAADVLWRLDGDKWVSVPVVIDPPTPHWVLYLDVGAASLQAIDSLLAEGRGRLPAQPPVEPVAVAHSQDVRRPNAFFRAGTTWEITFEGVTCHVRHLVGLDTIARLLTQPYTTIPAAVLLDRDRRGAGRIRPDVAAIEDLKEKIKELREERAPTEGATRDRELLQARLLKMLDKNGKPRPDDEGERDRKAVIARVTDALKRIRETHEALAAHLHQALDLSYDCIYAPQPKVDWILAPAGTSAATAPRATPPPERK